MNRFSVSDIPVKPRCRLANRDIPNALLAALLTSFALVFVLVMVSESIEQCVSELFGLFGEKNKVLTFLGLGMGGILLALQARASHRRAVAMEDTAKEQAEATKEHAKANRHTEQGQRQERLKNAIEHLGHASASVRLGGAYELFHIARDTEERHQTVLDILCAHIRRTTREDEYQKTYMSEPSEEIQSLLNLLFREQHEVFKGLDINLEESRLNGAILTGARFKNARLRAAHLKGAVLRKANLQNAVLYFAQLPMARLNNATLHGADLRCATLQGASLDCAKLQGAYLHNAQLHEARFFSTDLRGATSKQLYTWPPPSFAARIRKQSGKESDLSQVVFAGGLTQEQVDSLAHGLTDAEDGGRKASELQKMLQPHIGSPLSHELPPHISDDAKRTYTAQEAAQWIAEYEEAMSETPDAGAA